MSIAVLVSTWTPTDVIALMRAAVAPAAPAPLETLQEMASLLAKFVKQ
jgi:hypothetical protein